MSEVGDSYRPKADGRPIFACQLDAPPASTPKLFYCAQSGCRIGRIEIGLAPISPFQSQLSNAGILGMWALLNVAIVVPTLLNLIGVSSACIFSLFGVMRKLWFVLHYMHGEVTTDDVHFEDVDHSPKPVPSH